MVLVVTVLVHLKCLAVDASQGFACEFAVAVPLGVLERKKQTWRRRRIRYDVESPVCAHLRPRWFIYSLG